MEQLGATGNEKRDPRGWSVTVTYFALVNAAEVVFSTDSSWHVLNKNGDILNKSLAFDHAKLIKDAFLRLRSKAQYTTIALHVLSGELKQTSTRMAQLYKKSGEEELHFYMREIYTR